MSNDPHFSRWPIRKLKPKWFVLLDERGRPSSYHRTVSGALVARRELMEEWVRETNEMQRASESRAYWPSHDR